MKYKVMTTWERYLIVEVEANNLKEAIKEVTDLYEGDWLDISKAQDNFADFKIDLHNTYQLNAYKGG